LMTNVALLFAAISFAFAGDLHRLTIINRCSFDVWMDSLNNPDHRPLPDHTVHLAPGNSHEYYFPNGVWAGRWWPKLGCDSVGQNCSSGQSMEPCPPMGCQPPGDTKIEFNFQNGDGKSASTVTWYDISLVDGYSLPVSIIPRGGDSGECRSTMCRLSFDECPTNEAAVGDLRWSGSNSDARVAQCLSPCKKWGWPTPLGLGQSEEMEPGASFCCPASLTASHCKQRVEETKYVDVVRRLCPTAYSWAYDDNAGLHTCPPETVFDVTICPQN